MDNQYPITPVNFFQLSVECHKLSADKGRKGKISLNADNRGNFLLPSTAMVTDEEPYGEVSLGWSLEGIELFAKVAQPYVRSCYPNFAKGDSLEVCIDTRNVKSSGYNTRFCHHFVFLPESVDGRRAAEITRFRTDDAHELCNGEDLKVSSAIKSDSYAMQIQIPAHCLHGYDPAQYPWLGFTYRLNRAAGAPQHFSVCADDYQYEQQPSLWATVQLLP